MQRRLKDLKLLPVVEGRKRKASHGGGGGALGSIAHKDKAITFLFDSRVKVRVHMSFSNTEDAGRSRETLDSLLKSIGRTFS